MRSSPASTRPRATSSRSRCTRRRSTSWPGSNQHPGAQTACNVFIRFGAHNTYPDYIISNVNGVMLNVNPGAGGFAGRIADVTLFNPSLLTQTQ